jgi:hypothetical protein
MGFPSKERPFAKAADYEAAIKAAGSVGKYATEYGVTENTMRKWCKAAGADTKRGISAGAYQRTEATAILERMTDEELSAIVGLVGTGRACTILNTTKNTLLLHLRKRGVIPHVGDHSPKASMLSQRVRRLERDDAAIRELGEEIRASAAIGTPPAPIRRQPPPAPLKKRTPVDVILHVSDIQYGEVVHPEEVPGGGYSPEVFAEDRLPRYVAAVEGILRTVAQTNPIGTVWMAQGGDFVEGEGVFAGQHHHLAMNAGRQVDTLGKLWAQGVGQIASDAKNLGAKRFGVVGVVGNHGVHGGRKAGATPPDLSYDWLTYQMSALRLRGPDGVRDASRARPPLQLHREPGGP